MNVNDLSFKITNKNGMEVICDILSVVPNKNNSDEPYVVFTDYMLDDNDEFVLQYGRVIENNGEYVLKIEEDPNVVEYIKQQLGDEIVDYVNTQVQDELYE